MALLLIVIAALVACSNAGMIHDMYPQQQMMMQPQQQMMMVPMGNGGCQQNAQGQIPAGCEIPMQNVDNMEEYLEQQMQQQQYETQQMAEQVKAQFEAMVAEVNMKKHRYVMSLVTEYVSFCTCAGSDQAITQALFVDNAKKLNITDGIEIWDSNRQPYEAKNEEDARALIFGGLVKTMCESASAYMTFAQQVQNRIPAFIVGKK